MMTGIRKSALRRVAQMQIQTNYNPASMLSRIIALEMVCELDPAETAAVKAEAARLEKAAAGVVSTLTADASQADQDGAVADLVGLDIAKDDAKALVAAALKAAAPAPAPAA